MEMAESHSDSELWQKLHVLPPKQPRMESRRYSAGVLDPAALLRPPRVAYTQGQRQRRIHPVSTYAYQSNGKDSSTRSGPMTHAQRLERGRSLPHDGAPHFIKGVEDESGEEKTSSRALLVTDSGASSLAAPSMDEGEGRGPGSIPLIPCASLPLQLVAMALVGAVGAFVATLSLFLLFKGDNRQGPKLLRILQSAILAFTFGSSFSAVAVSGLQIFLSLRWLGCGGGDGWSRVEGFLGQGIWLRSIAFLGLAVSFPLLLFALIIWVHVTEGSGLTAYLLSGILGAPLCLLLLGLAHGVYAWGWGHLRIPLHSASASNSTSTPPSSTQDDFAKKLSTLV